MKPTKMRNRQIYKATFKVRSGQVGAPLSGELRERYGRRSVRVVKGDNVSVTRGVYKDIQGKVARVMVSAGRVAIEGIKKEKGKGDKIDILIHASNLVVTSLNTDDSKRMAKIDKKGQPPGDASGITEAATDKVATDASASGIKEAAAGEIKEDAVTDESADRIKEDVASDASTSEIKEAAAGEIKEDAVTDESAGRIKEAVASDASTSEIKEAATGENKEGAVADESAGTNKPDTKSNEADTNSKMHEQQTGESK
jgi:large subunit ribosomal protein L24